jgi:thioesterase domain-containing protein/aryl carrier-like protein
VLASLWCEILGLKGLGVHDNFFDLGGDSLLAVRLVGAINAAHGARLRVSDLYRAPTIELLAARMGGADAAEPRGSCIVALRSDGAGLPVCFVHGGPKEVRLAGLIETAESFVVDQPWPAAWMAPAVAGRRPPLPSAAEVVSTFIEAVHAHAGERPFAVAGHSTKGVLAFELARQLLERGAQPTAVLLFDSWRRRPSGVRVATHRARRLLEEGLEERVSAREALERILDVPRELARELGRTGRSLAFPLVGRRIPKAGEWELTSHADEQGTLHRWGAVEPIYDNILRTGPTSPLPLRGVLFRAAREDDPARALDPTLGWGGMFSRGLEIVPVAADHDFTQGPDDALLSAQLSAAMAGLAGAAQV